MTLISAALTLGDEMPKPIPYVSVPELARDLGMPTNRLYYYLERLKVRTVAMGSAQNSVRFVRRGDVLSIVESIAAYRKRRPGDGLTTEEAAAELGVLPSTVRTLVSQKRLKARHAGRLIVVDREDLARYARGRRRRIA